MSKKPFTKIPRNPLFIPDEQYDRTRETYNKMIIALLNEYLQKNPQIRFWQALLNLSEVPIDFYEEPWETYKKIKENLDKISKNS